MGKRRGEAYETLGRDPFEGMEWSSESGRGEGEATEAERDAGSRPYEQPAPASALRGKGVWLLFSGDVDLAIEMAVAIGATHILYKTGHRGMFFLEAARRVHDRVREAGLIPFAWPFIHCDEPVAEAEVVIKSIGMGYEGVVLDIEDQAAGKTVGARTLGQRALEQVDPERLYYTSYPNIWQHLDVPYREMNEFCRGGFMPQCYPTFQRTPRTVIERWAYGEHTRWSEEWGNMPPLYPILAAYRDEHASDRLSVQEFLGWVEALASYAPSFYSIYRAGTTDRELWPLLAALGESVPVPAHVPEPRPADVRPAPQPESPSVADPDLTDETESASPPVYRVVTVNDTLRGLCRQYDITPEQFWKWNGHLWDERGMPRDALYLQEGWRVRVG
jgi:hypothetical protein